MQNYVQERIVLTVVAAAVVKSGDLVQTGVIVGVAACDAEVGDRLEVRVQGVSAVPKLVRLPTCWLPGVSRRGRSEPVSARWGCGKNSIGWITEASSAGKTSVAVRLCPSMGGGTATFDQPGDAVIVKNEGRKSKQVAHFWPAAKRRIDVLKTRFIRRARQSGGQPYRSRLRNELVIIMPIVPFVVDDRVSDGGGSTIDFG